MLYLIAIGIIGVGVFFWYKRKKTPVDSGFTFDYRAEKVKRKEEEVQSWDTQYRKTLQEAWARQFGIPFDSIYKYMDELRSYQRILSSVERLKGFKDTPCADERESYTVRTLSGSTCDTYYGACECKLCKYQRLLTTKEVKEDRLRILEASFPNFQSPIEDREKIGQLVNSWKELHESTRGQLTL